MKKIMMVFFMLLYIFSIKTVFAQDQYKLTLLKQDGIYYIRRGGVNDTDIYYVYKMNDLYAYCIEPGVPITTYNYLGNEEFDLSLSEEVKEKIELIGYYGREYPGHDNVKYSMAAQALIWELTGVKKVTFWTGKNGTGKEIDISSERKEIMDLVNNHKTLPNFPTNFYGDIKHKMEIEDTNKVLDNFEVVNDGMQDVYIENNILHIMPKTPGMFNITLRRKNYDEYKTIIFVGKDSTSSQKMARLHFSKTIEQEITISIDGVRLLIHKVDEQNNPILKENIAFTVKDLETGEYICDTPDCIYRTDCEGIILTKGLLFHEYEIEEIENQIVEGYTWNNNKMHINITYDDNIEWNNEVNSHINLYFSNKEVIGNIEIQKYGEELKITDNNLVYNKINLGNINFSLYDSSDKLIKNFNVNNDGYYKLNNLKIGKYYLIENTKLDNYINKDKIIFEIKQTNQYDNIINVKLDIQNYLKKGTLEFSKEDISTSSGIPNTIISIYDSNNNLLLTKETDNNGKIIINNLPIGKYYIKEVKANDNYLISDEIVTFEIKENGEIVKARMTNKMITGILEINKIGEEEKIIDNNITYNKKNLSNIKFLLYKDDNTYLDTLITDSNGYAKKEDLRLGNYYLIEDSSNNNYIIDNSKYYFTISQKERDDKNILVKTYLENYLKKGTLEFSKIDSKTKIGIPNTVIGIYDSSNKLLLSRKTDNNGKIVIYNIPYGKYYLKEIKPNEYYLKSNEIIEFEIKENNEVIKKEMINERITGTINITKKGEEYKFANDEIIYSVINLEGIKFDLYDINDNYINSLITDSNGFATLSKLDLGKYYLKEENNNTNYILSDKYYFEINKEESNEDVIINLNINNYLKKGILEFTKEDLVTSSGIPNTIIEIYDSNNNLLFTKETDNNGKVIINDLPIGKYYIIEKEANTNYQITNEHVFFEIKENNEIVKARMTNERIVVEVPKTDKNNNLFNVFILFTLLFWIGIKCYEKTY